MKTINELLLIASKNENKLVHFYKKKKHESYSYQEIFERAKVIASLLQAKGMKEGDAVALILPSDLSFYDAFFGVNLAGGIPTALYPPVRLARFDEWKEKTSLYLDKIEAKIVITFHQIAALLERDDLKVININLLNLKEMRSDAVFTPYQQQEETPAFIQFSSGTTGDSKPILISQKNVMTNLNAILSEFPLKREEMSCVSWLPLYHDMGLVGTFLAGLYTQRELTLMPPEEFLLYPLLWLKELTRKKATIAVAPNFAFGLIADRLTAKDLEREEINLSTLKVFLCGAEPIHPQTMEDFSKLLAPFGLQKEVITPVYGLAEATLAVTFSSSREVYKVSSFERDSLIHGEKARKAKNGEAIPANLVSLGKPIQDVELVIWDAKENTLDEGHIGEVVIRGDAITKGIYRGHTSLQTKEGWLKTGDLGFLDKGELYLCGRLKDIIIINGKNYDPTYFEQKFIHEKSLRKGIVIAFGHYNPQKRTEEVIVLCESKKKMAPAEVELMRKRVNEGLLPKVSKLEVLPPGTILRTSSGKLRRRMTSELWLDGKLETPAKVSPLLFALKNSAKFLSQRIRDK